VVAASPAQLPTIAFFISSYGSMDDLHRLASTLRRAEPASPIVIHHDVFQTPVDKDRFSDLTDVHILTSDHPMVWGDITLEAVRWRVFRWILDNLDVAWVVLLSGQDYPIAPLSRLRRTLTETAADGLVEAQQIDLIEDETVRAEADLRYHYQYLSAPTFGLANRVSARTQARARWVRNSAITLFTRHQRKVFVYTSPPALRLPSRIGVRSRRSPFRPDFPSWLNSAWFALSDQALRVVVEYVERHPDFVRYYSRTVIPVESATATIVCNDPGLTIDNTAIHAVRWQDPVSGRPDTYSLADLDFLIDSGRPFARKFDYRDTALLDALDEIVFGGVEQ
jgi:hypothetical protein